ncbi:MAG: PEGA domain-containing protein [Pseudomonadota bacterium]
MKHGLSCILVAFLLLTHSRALAQEFQVNVDVKGNKGKKFLESVKQGICDSVLDHLTFNVAGSTVPSSCNMKVKTAEFLINAEAVFEKPPVSVNLYIEVRGKGNGQIIGQKAHTVNVPGDTQDPKKLLYDETAKAMTDLLPKGWKPPSGDAAGGEAVEESGSAAEGAVESPEEGGTEEEEEEVLVEEEEKTAPVEPRERASLLLAISAKGAKVLIDGNDMGLSPLGILEGITVGKHEISVEKEGFKTFSGSIDVQPAGESLITRHDITLETTEKKKKKGVAGKWWLWTILGGIVLGGAAAAIGVVYGGGDEGADAVPFPNY